MDRIKVLKQKAFQKKGFDGFLVFNGINQLYLAGVQGTSCLLIPEKGEGTIYVYSVNYEQAKAEGKGFKIEPVKRNENLMAKIATQVKSFKMKKLAVDMLSYESYRSLAKELRGKTKLKMQGNLIWDLRKVKDGEEVKLVKRACELTSAGMKVAYEAIRPGIKEIEVAAEIEYAMRKKGSWGTSFETIVASGARSAFPHGGCLDKKIRPGELVVVDIGARYMHYCGDMTRTISAGKPTAKQKKLYEIVRELPPVKTFREAEVRLLEDLYPETPAEALRLGLFADILFFRFPLHAKRRIRRHVIEAVIGQTILRERIAELDVIDALPLDQHVGTANRIRLVVVFLPEYFQPRIGIQLVQIVAPHRQHPARPADEEDFHESIFPC